MESIKRTVVVTIEKRIEIELTPAVFGGMSMEEYLSEFRRGLWHVDGVDDVVKYAASMAATGGAGYELDGIGLLDRADSKYPRVPDVKFRIIDDDVEVQIESGSM